MSGETEENISGWTTDTLRAHILQMMIEHDRRYEQRFAAQEKAVASALGAAERAVAKAETATEKRFEGVNEFRSQLADQAQTFMPRTETEIRLGTIETRLTDLQSRADQSSARAVGRNDVVAWVIAGIASVAALVAVVVAIAHP